MKNGCVNLARAMKMRKFFAHDLARWKEFCKRYVTELKRPDSGRLLAELEKIARSGTLTLVYSARGQEHNRAVVLKKLLEGRLQRGV